jgi:hypothetical protein
MRAWVHATLIAVASVVALAAAFGLAWTVISIASPADIPSPPSITPSTNRTQLLLPLEQSCFVGTSIDYSAWNYDLTKYSQALGFVPASFVLSVDLPTPNQDLSGIESLLSQIAYLQAIAVITVRPISGLTRRDLPDDAIKSLAQLIRKYEERGLKVIVRFAQQMNGSWYPWGQSPTQYIIEFRRFTSLLRMFTISANTLWAPSPGHGYPWPGEAALHACMLCGTAWPIRPSGHQAIRPSCQCSQGFLCLRCHTSCSWHLRM